MTPAVVETLTVRVPLGDRRTRIETEQEIVTARWEVWFATPCRGQVTPDFTASLQCALAARDHCSGPITGAMDKATRDAVRRHQRRRGLESGFISLTAARDPGLVAMDASG